MRRSKHIFSFGLAFLLFLSSCTSSATQAITTSVVDITDITATPVQESESVSTIAPVSITTTEETTQPAIPEKKVEYATYAQEQIFSNKTLTNSQWLEVGENRLWNFYSDNTMHIVDLKDNSVLEYKYHVNSKNIVTRVSVEHTNYEVYWSDTGISLQSLTGSVYLDFVGMTDKLSTYLPDEILHNNANPAIWQVKDSKLGNVIYLIGTFHVLDNITTELPSTVLSTLALCDECYFEVTLDDALAHPDAERRIYYDTNDSLRRHISSDDYMDFKTEFSKVFGYYSDEIDTIKPSGIVTLISSLGMQFISDLNASDGGFDTLLESFCLSNNIPVHSIEDVYAHYYAAAPDGLDELQLAMIFDELDSLRNISQYTKDFSEQYAAWLTGDYESCVDVLEVIPGELPDELKEQYSQYLDILLYDRNDVMTTKMIEELQDRDTELFAVGVSHCAGTQGILTKLKDAGYTVSRVH